MIKKILLGLVIIVVILVVVILLQPAHYHVERSATISAPPATVFAQVNDFHKWEAWSPWAKIDPSMKHNYDGAPAGACEILHVGSSTPRKRVDAVLGIPPDKVVLVRPQSIPKTSSGKIRRKATCALYESGELHGVRRPPWVQIVRLWFEHLGSWLKLITRRASTWVRGAYLSSMVLATATFCRCLKIR